MDYAVDTSTVKLPTTVSLIGISGVNRESGAVELRLRAGKQEVSVQRTLDPDDITDATTLGELAVMALIGVAFKADESGRVEAVVPEPGEK